MRAPVSSAIAWHVGDELLVRPQVLRSAQPDVHAHLRPADQQRVAHVVAGVSEVAVRDVPQRLVAELGHRQEVGEDLGGMELVGQAVPDRDPGELRQVLDDLLAEPAVLDAVVDAAEDARRVLHRLLVADLRPLRAEVGDVRPLVVRGDLERDPRPGGGLLEDDGDVLAAHVLALVPAVLRALEVAGQVQEEPDLPRAEVQELDETAIPEVVAHLLGALDLCGGVRGPPARRHRRSNTTFLMSRCR